MTRVTPGSCGPKGHQCPLVAQPRVPHLLTLPSPLTLSSQGWCLHHDLLDLGRPWAAVLEGINERRQSPGSCQRQLSPQPLEGTSPWTRVDETSELKGEEMEGKLWDAAPSFP